MKWKSKIRPLEQILGSICYRTFFDAPCIVSYVRQEQFDLPAEDGDLLQDGLVLDPALAQPDTLNLIILPPGSGQPLKPTIIAFLKSNLTLSSDSSPRRKTVFSTQKSGRLHWFQEDLKFDCWCEENLWRLAFLHREPLPKACRWRKAAVDL